MVEGAALEMLFRGNFNEGSNPSLSVLSTDKIITVLLSVPASRLSGFSMATHPLETQSGNS